MKTNKKQTYDELQKEVKRLNKIIQMAKTATASIVFHDEKLDEIWDILSEAKETNK